MGWDIKEEKHNKAKNAESTKNVSLPEIKMPGCENFVPLGKTQIKRKYKDDVGKALIVIIDEAAELLQPSGVKSEAGKEEDALKQEIIQIIKSLTQLGRSAKVHVILCTQRNDASIIPGVIQNNSLALNTPVLVCNAEEEK